MRFGLVGLGRATEMFHLPALAQIPSARVVAGFDPAAERRAAFTRATGADAYGSFDELLERCRPDVVVIATPPASHAELTLRALSARCHVFCEKPFVESSADAERVLETAASVGRLVAVNHEFREKNSFRAVRDAVASGRFGRLVFCQIWQLMDLAPWDEATAWRASMADRTLLEGGVHLVDLLLAIFGGSPNAVYARRSAGFSGHQDADPIQLMTLEFGDGRLGQITINRLFAAATRYLEVRADCEEASLRASLGGRAVMQMGKKRAERTGVRIDYGPGGLAWSERGLTRQTLARDGRNPGVLGTRRLIEGLVRAVEDGTEPPSSGEEARRALAVIDAAYESGRTGMRIELPALSPVEASRQG